MGEQGAKNLRGSSMEDVIFAGTSSRPPLGRAQVSLTIGQHRSHAGHRLHRGHDLAHDLAQRRLRIRHQRLAVPSAGHPGAAERYGDWGQQMHVIVGQGRLDAIPQGPIRAATAPSSRRRPASSNTASARSVPLRKLANTETNLSRLDDLLGEIRRQLGPLGRQARISPTGRQHPDQPA